MFATSNELSRKTFNTPDAFVPAGVASMKTVLLPENWVFLQGKAHVDYRKKLVPLFTRAALSAYLPLQQVAYRHNIGKWLKEAENGKPMEMQYRVRDMNMTTSLGVFVGARYLPTDADLELSEAFKVITFALQLVNIPFAIPGTAVYDAVQNRNKIMSYITAAAAKARARLAQPGEVPESLLDRWVDALNKEREEWEKTRQGEPPRQFTDRELAMTVMTMVFASQDASTSSLTWAIQVLADHPQVLAKIREEQFRLRPNGEPLTYEMMQQMTYTWRVVKELLRFRPPVLMMLYEARKNTTLGGHPIGKGTLVVGSVYPSLFDPSAYENPDSFDPDRFSPERAEDTKSAQNYMVWGHGPHTCIGREYAMSHLVAFISYLSTTCEWKHVVTPDSEKIAILATTYPMDRCQILLKPFGAK